MCTRQSIPREGISAENVTRDAVDRAFLTALLLTSDPREAESAVLWSISSMEDAELSAERLVRGSIAACVERRAECAGRGAWEDSALVPELRSVLRLPDRLRHCFVLRVLLGLRQEICARLLHLEVSEINRATLAAMLRLPGLSVSKN
jgi:DNA-directed RNA polymerase specialized sigma24 family protein